VDNSPVKIEYIYSNPQVNQITAHLVNGEEVPYKLDVIDLIHCYAGEYKRTINIQLDFMTNSRISGVKRTVKVMNVNVRTEEPDEIVDYVLHNIHTMPEADIVLTIPGSGPITISSDVRDSAMTDDYLSSLGD
jgi:hypothetical protein